MDMIVCKKCNGNNVQLLKSAAFSIGDYLELRERFFCVNCNIEFEVAY